MKFINIGFGNIISVDKIVSIVGPESAPIKRLIQDSKEEKRVIDATCGRRTRSVIITTTNHIVLSSVQAETIVNRFNLL